MEDSLEKTENSDIETLGIMYEKIIREMKDHKGDKTEKFHFEPLVKHIDKIMENTEEKTVSKTILLAMKSSLIFEHAKLLMINEYVTLSLENLRYALNIIEELKLHPHITYLYYRITNQLAYHLCKFEQLNEARELLEYSYILYKSIPVKSDILLYSTDDLFQNTYLNKGNNVLKFERLITHNLQTQAWLYNRMNMSLKFLIYHHTVLKRQLEMKDGSAFSWFYKCVRLGAFFFGSNKFLEARHQLSTACSVIRDYELKILKHRAEPQFVENWNNLRKLYAEAGRYWMKYVIFLLDASCRQNSSKSSSNTSTNLNEIFINNSKEKQNLEKVLIDNSLYCDTEKLINDIVQNIESNNTESNIERNVLFEMKPTELTTEKTDENNEESILGEVTKIISALNDKKNEMEMNESNKTTEIIGDQNVDEKISKIEKSLNENIQNQKEDEIRENVSENNVAANLILKDDKNINVSEINNEISNNEETCTKELEGNLNIVNENIEILKEKDEDHEKIENIECKKEPKSICESTTQENEKIPNEKETQIKENENTNSETINDAVKEIFKNIIKDDVKSETQEKKQSEDNSLNTNNNLNKCELNSSEIGEENQKETTNEKKTNEIHENKPNETLNNDLSDDLKYDFKFSSIHAEYFEAQVTAELIQHPEQAKRLFAFVQGWMNHVKSFYSVEDYPVEYIEMNLDMSDIYNYLSLFETDINNQYELLRNRVNILEQTSIDLQTTKPQYSLFISIELLHELTQAQIDLMKLNVRRISTMRRSRLFMPDIYNDDSNDAKRKLDALLDIRKRLGRSEMSEYDFKLSTTDMPRFHLV